MEDRVLIVDDDQGIRQTIRSIVEDLGYACDTAPDGQEALGLVESRRYLCVFTDIMMPRMTGLELIKKIKARDISIPIIVITGYASLEIAIDAMKCGASDFLPKPFKMSQIQILLNKMRREKTILEENRRFSDTLQLYRIIDNLKGQLEDKAREISSLKAISEKIVSLKGIRDLVGAIVDVSKQLIGNSEVKFYPVRGLPEPSRDNGPMPELQVPDELLAGKIVRVDNSFLDGERHFQTLFPLTIEGQVFGALDVRTETLLDEEAETKILYLLNRSAERMENVALYEGLYENILSTLRSMAKILDARDPHTSQHSTRVTNFSIAIANALGLSAEERDVLYIASSLHDIGKVGIPDSILLKPDRLTEEEFTIIRKHPDIGADILKQLPPMYRETEIIRHHHERYDGKGYPAGIGDNEIPLLSRIITIADAYDAMTSDRPYRKGLAVGMAVEEITRCAGSQFDPELARLFLHKVIGVF
ncbi:MAG TPA: response regulator [Deltaproteobacteria bacterium]|nr:response regulator [Deltaproteobacteria bacterium]HOM29773.1 response regulator [Deltaproteobacteria bacterium]